MMINWNNVKILFNADPNLMFIGTTCVTFKRIALETRGSLNVSFYQLQRIPEQTVSNHLDYATLDKTESVIWKVHNDLHFLHKENR